MKIKLLSIILCFGVMQASEKTQVINNSDAEVHVDYDVPIHSRADVGIKPLKSQQELQDLLHEAIISNSTQRIMQVVRAGADVNLFKDGKAPLMWATILKKMNSVEVLKKCGAIIPCPKNMLYRAILNDSYEGVKSAIQAGAEVSQKIGPHTTNTNNTKEPVVWAVMFAHSAALKALLECGARGDKGRIYSPFRGHESLTPISAALMLGDIKSALILLKHSNENASKILINGCDPFEYVARIDPSQVKDLILEFLQELINRGYDINSSCAHSGCGISGGEISHYKSAWASVLASPFCSVEVLGLLVKNGANPNQQINGGYTPLHMAIQNNNIKAVKFLLNAGVDLSKKANVAQGRGTIKANPLTPLDYARSLAQKNVENRVIREIITLLVNYKSPY